MLLLLRLALEPDATRAPTTPPPPRFGTADDSMVVACDPVADDALCASNASSSSSSIVRPMSSSSSSSSSGSKKSDRPRRRMEKAYRHDLIDTTVLLVVVAAMPLIKVLRRWYGVVGASKQLRQWPHTNVARQEHYATAVVLKAADLTPLLSLLSPLKVNISMPISPWISLLKPLIVWKKVVPRSKSWIGSKASVTAA